MTEERNVGLPTGCANSLECGVIVERQVACLRDELTGRIYCLPCGERLRYHRRKAIGRGEDPPRTLHDADRRLDTKR